MGLDPEEDLVSLTGWPSEWKHEPYLEELQHLLNDCSEDLESMTGRDIAIPDEFIAYNLSKWSGTRVPVTHPLVVDHNHWRDVYFDIEWDNNTPN